MAGIFFNRRQVQCVLFTGQADGVTTFRHAPFTADTVNIIFTVIRQIMPVKDVSY